MRADEKISCDLDLVICSTPEALLIAIGVPLEDQFTSFVANGRFVWRN
jgi:hypothetical protein